MTDDKNTNNDDSNSIFEAEGIIIENDAYQEIETADNLKTEDIEKELFNAVGVVTEKTEDAKIKPTTDDIKEELNKGGIEVSSSEPENNS